MFGSRFVYVNIIIIIFLFLTATEFSAKEAIIEIDQLNVRSGPGLQYDVIGQVHWDEVHPVMQSEDDWVEIEWNNKSGWLTAEYVTISEARQIEKPFSPYSGNNESIKNIDDKTHIRNGPSVNYSILDFAQEQNKINILEENDEWFKVNYNNEIGYIFKGFVENDGDSNKLKDKIIVLDVGHGGYDVGAISVNNNYEKELTLYTAKELKRKLEQLGAQVLLTRENDNYVSLASRSNFINTFNADVAISLHYNSFPELPDTTGVSTYYYDIEDQFLAEAIQNKVVEKTNANNRSIKKEDFQVLRQSTKPAVLIELDFISNETTEKLLFTKMYQQKLVAGIVSGLNSYFNETKEHVQ